MSQKRKRISLALQGGGALGAYTWGALDRVLEDERVEITAISGSSAGAMCGVVLADGFEEGGADGARESLRAFWQGVARAGQTNPYRRTPMMAFLNSFMPGWAPESYLALWADVASRFASPYDFNPLNVNPLKEVLEELVDFERVRKCKGIQLFVGATNVETGRIRIFNNKDLTGDHIMASACLPQLFQAVVIDGAPYWDGGFTGNPALFPLFDVKSARDIVIVQINPVERSEAPRAPVEITARVNEITFNNSLLAELRAIDFVARLVDDNHLPKGRYRKMLIHNVSETQALTPLGLGVDLNTDLAFFDRLFETGRSAAERWLGEHFDALGERSTVDLAAMFRDAPKGGEAKPLR
ncbi:patatin-like phospholipase family protein [Candidatus Viadribacter manganicus]|uniref:Patatin n=1 Tax=Candidatus Viadribacter manganicus TaxID=1759059 RepID=A0A1B1AHX6_9PROT|nr:patatin-like phospholipase family protein [Candidatus Viadribacter manganicus]ANP46141.1 patatin [Candidatus Viadribacter manganicus]